MENLAATMTDYKRGLARLPAREYVRIPNTEDSLDGQAGVVRGGCYRRDTLCASVNTMTITTAKVYGFPLFTFIYICLCTRY